MTPLANGHLQEAVTIFGDGGGRFARDTVRARPGVVKRP
jgi:hypothetical protein